MTVFEIKCILSDPKFIQIHKGRLGRLRKTKRLFEKMRGQRFGVGQGGKAQLLPVWWPLYIPARQCAFGAILNAASAQKNCQEVRDTEQPFRRKDN